jgi:hypothetical protein
MAVYNGFSTRKRESVYNDLTFELMQHLQAQILTEYKHKKIDNEAWQKDCQSLLKRMEKMEREKFMPPKYSTACNDLKSHLSMQLSPSSMSPDKELPIIQGIFYIASVAKLLKKKFLH